MALKNNRPNLELIIELFIIYFIYIKQYHWNLVFLDTETKKD